MRNYLVALQSGEEIVVEAENRTEVSYRLINEYGFSADEILKVVGTISDYEAECGGYDTY